MERKHVQFNLDEALTAFLFIFLPLILGFGHIYWQKVKGPIKVDILFNYYLFIGVGIQGVVTGFIQIIYPELVIDYVQWPYSPFLWELGTANLSYGILGLLSLWLNKGWQLAAALGYGLFLFFTGFGHLVRLSQIGISPGDGGAFLLSDLFVALALFILLALELKGKEKS